MSVQRAVGATWIVGALLVLNSSLRFGGVDQLASHDDLLGGIQVFLTALFLLGWGVSVAEWSRRHSNGPRVPNWCKVSISLTGVLILTFFAHMTRFVLGR